MRHIASYLLFEQRQQLELPFDGKDPIHDKPVHVHLTDALEDLHDERVSRKYYSDEYRIDKTLEKQYMEAAVSIIDSGISSDREAAYDWYYEFFDSFNIDWSDQDELSEYFTDDFARRIVEDEMELDEVCTELADDENLLGSIKDRWRDFAEDQVSYLCQDMLDAVNTSINDSEDGLIEVWRAIDVGDGSYDDAYQNIVEGYGGLGIYWAWNQDAAEAHWGVDGKPFVLHGMLRPQDVDWKQTVYKNAYSLRDECEIETNKDAYVQIVGYEVDGKYVELERAYVVPVQKK